MAWVALACGPACCPNGTINCAGTPVPRTLTLTVTYSGASCPNIAPPFGPGNCSGSASYTFTYDEGLGYWVSEDTTCDGGGSGGTMDFKCPSSVPGNEFDLECDRLSCGLTSCLSYFMGTTTRPFNLVSASPFQADINPAPDACVTAVMTE